MVPQSLEANGSGDVEEFQAVVLNRSGALTQPVELQEPEATAVETTSAATDSSREPTRWVLVFCGHPGDASHHGMYAKTAQSLVSAFVDRFGCAAANVWLRFGEVPLESDPPCVVASRGLATAEGISADVAALKERLAPKDSVWVVLLGHAHHVDGSTFFNLPGPDISDADFGSLFKDLEAREQVFFITTPVSGYAIKHLTRRGRVVITATEPANEVNETLYHLDLAETLGDPQLMAESDWDRDGTISVFDLHITVARHVALRYQAQKELQTEHAQLDDNGDGRGTEIQLDFLPPALGGTPRYSWPPRAAVTGDGVAAANIVIPIAKRED